ncbi:MULTISPECIES: hypothetical protein [unclassified Streptomyces]|uniref:hypothetical protein n=1 Tax=unclassified Streptomyces TaxID=2593676 RepID=UPI0011E795E2|nr:hypothetical protein [Streptomyces sp. sk2.1]TXS79720.1 hypothetical protein EAO76_02050 [Streptomyces sp. sk2.1]
MPDVSGFNINSADGLSNDETAMLETLKTLDRHLTDMDDAGVKVKTIQGQVRAAYQAVSSETHAAGIDEWLKLHSRVMQRTQFFRDGTAMAKQLLVDAEFDANTYAAGISGEINPK